MKPTVVLGAHAGGLGDHLLYSTLPARFARAGNRVLVSTAPCAWSGHPAFRNDEIRQLVWGYNPFVSGFTEDPPTHGGVTAFAEDLRFVHLAKSISNPIAAMEFAHGFTPENTVPYIGIEYRDPGTQFGRILADARSTSQPFTTTTFDRFTDEVCRWQHLPRSEVLSMTSLASGLHGSSALANAKPLPITSIFEYAEAIASCEVFLTTESGGNSLAAALRRRPTYALMTTRSFNDRLFVFPNVRYHVTGAESPDYHEGWK